MNHTYLNMIVRRNAKLLYVLDKSGGLPTNMSNNSSSNQQPSTSSGTFQESVDGQSDLGFRRYEQMVEQNMPYSICLETEFDMPTPAQPAPVQR